MFTRATGMPQSVARLDPVNPQNQTRQAHTSMSISTSSRPLMRTAFAAVIFIASSAMALAETPAQYMQRVANELVAASRTASPTAFATVLRSHADLPAIGLTALGGYASSLPRSDRPAYYNGMVNWIARYAAKEAPKYPVGKAVVLGQSSASAGSTYVDSRITLRDGSTYDVRWRIVKRGNVYKVREAEIIGFEMTSFLNTLFQNYISENGGNPKALVIALNR